MSYVQGFVLAVPTANRDTYISHAEAALPLFKEFGATRLVEGWGDDVPDGKINDFKGAVQARPDETVLFSWIEFPDKATCDAAGQKMMNDPRIESLGPMPFDGKRMIYAGFDPVLDEGPGGRMGYVDGYLIPVPAGKKDAYVTVARNVAPIFLDCGATRVIECWGVDVPDGKITDFRRATHAQEGEQVVFSWVEWPSKDARVAGWEQFMADERVKTPPEDMPFDGKRMIYGGFSPVVDA